MHRHSILWLVLTLASLTAVAAAQDADAPVEAPTSLPAEPASQPSAASEAVTKLADKAAIAEAVSKLCQQLKPLPLGEADTPCSLGQLLGDAWPDMLGAMIAEMEISPVSKKDGKATVTVTANRDDVVRWLTFAQTSPQAGDALKAAPVAELKLDEPLTITTTAIAPKALDVVPLVTDPNAKIPEPPLWKEHVVGQGRLLAERAARADALKRLAQRSRGIAINDALTVESFIANSDQPDVDLRQFLRGAKTLGLRCREDALIFEVVVEGSRRTMLASFTGWADAHYKGESVDLVALRKAVEEGIDQRFTETGSAMPPKETLRGIEPEAIVRLQAVTGDAVPMWATANFTAEASQANAAPGVLERDILTQLLQQVWTAKMSEQTLGSIAADSEPILYAVILAALMRSPDVSRDTGTNTVTVKATMLMQPAWRIIERHILDHGLLPGMEK